MLSVQTREAEDTILKPFKVYDPTENQTQSTTLRRQTL